MFIDIVPNRNSPPAVLLREAHRDKDGRPQKRTLANLSKLPPGVIEALKVLLKGGGLSGTEPRELAIERSLPHGHVAAVLGTVRKLALDRLLLSKARDEASRRSCDLVVAMMVDRLIAPRSKLGFVRAVDEETATTSLGAVLGLGRVKEREAYEALDWLVERQERVENGLARRHLKDGVLVLYDVTSSYFEGRRCPLAQYGHSRDHRSDRPQIVYGLLCTREGLPIAVEVFEGDTADPRTLKAQIDKLKSRFGIKRMVLVGDRGMITAARLRDDLAPAGLDWITCLRAPQIQALALDRGPLQLSLFDERDLAEISSPDFPGERLIVCRNRDLARERAREREASGRDRTRAGAHPGAGAPQGLRLARCCRDRPGGGRGDQRQEDGQALRPGDPRWSLRLAAQARSDRGRGAARRHLCDPHQRAGGGSRPGACGSGLQGPLPGRARLPIDEDHRSRDPVRSV